MFGQSVATWHRPRETTAFPGTNSAQVCVEDPAQSTQGSFQNTCLTNGVLTLDYTPDNWQDHQTVVLRSQYNPLPETLVEGVNIQHQITSTTPNPASVVLPKNVFQTAVVDLPTVSHMTPKSTPSTGGGSGVDSTGRSVLTSEQAKAVQYWHRRLPSVPSSSVSSASRRRRLSNISQALDTPGLVQVFGTNFGNSNPGATMMVNGVEGGTSIWRR